MYQEVKVHHKTLKGGTVHNVDKLSEIELESNGNKDLEFLGFM